jgi:hypothetical protein
MNASASFKDTAQGVRRILLAIVAFGVAGTLVELIFIGHNQDAVQWLPFGLLGATGVGLVWVARSPSPRALHGFRALMAVVTLSSTLGLYFHLRGNMAFELESDPSLAGFALLLESVQGGTPILAPGILAQVGLLGLAFTYRHPNLIAACEVRTSQQTGMDTTAVRRQT